MAVHPYIAAHTTMVIDGRRMRLFEVLSSLSREVTRLDAVVADIVNQQQHKTCSARRHVVGRTGYTRRLTFVLAVSARASATWCWWWK